MGHYEVLDRVAVADAAFAIEGSDPADLFETAARALVELMVDPASVPLRVVRDVVLEAPELDLLLFDWLSELIFRKDRDAEVFPETCVTVEPGPPCRLVATLRGGVIDPATTVRRADPKAVTFHRFAVERRGDGWRAQVVIDV